MSRYRPNPPPMRDGVSASCVVLPQGPWETVAQYLAHRFTLIAHAQWLQRMASGEVIDASGQRLAPDAKFRPGLRLYYYRTLEAEARIPFEARIVWHDAHLLVVDKPHFLPVLPSGQYVQETVLVRLKRQLGLHDVAALHRIDRDTAGLVMFSVNPASRNAYYALFRNRTVVKTYECIAPWNAQLPWPMQRHSRICEAAHFMQQTEVEGEPNALTKIAPLEVLGSYARYRLHPVTGKRHQLRVHMAALGLPIVNDGIYPVLTPPGADYSRPLQLLAQSIAFTDPLTAQQRHFASAQRLWPLAALAGK